MDDVAIVTLRAEVDEDLRVLREAAADAKQRFGNGRSPDRLDGCAFNLVRFYNILEQMGLRVAKAFENHIDDDSGWHTELVRRLSLEVPDVRPRFFPENLIESIKELRGFRHVAVHAYDLKLDRERMSRLIGHAKRVAKEAPQFVKIFFNKVKRKYKS